MVYRTLSVEAQGIYKVKGSKFEAFAFPVENLEQIQQHLSQLQRVHHKARHHCYAYIMGHDGSELRSFDDGEPRHSAGDPILGQIRSFNLTNVLIVVVRYFGGTKLGIGGLINAYREAARGALEAGIIIEKEPGESWILTFDYPDMNKVMQLVKELKLTVVNQKNEQRCEMRLEVPLSKKAQVDARLQSLHRVKIKY